MRHHTRFGARIGGCQDSGSAEARCGQNGGEASPERRSHARKIKLFAGLGLGVRCRPRRGARTRWRRFIGHLRKATVELVGVTYYRPNVKSRWWRPDGTSAEIGPYLWKEHKTVGATIDWGTKEERFLPERKADNGLNVGRGTMGVAFLLRLSDPSTKQSSYGDDRYDRSTADTSRPGRYRPTERPRVVSTGMTVLQTTTFCDRPLRSNPGAHRPR